MCHVLLELADALGAEGVRDSFSFAGMLCTVTGIEKASLDRDEGVVIVAVKKCLCQLLLMRICGQERKYEEKAVEAGSVDYLFSHPPVWL